MIIVIGPLGLLFLAAIAFRPLRRFLGYIALLLGLIGLGAFGHVEPFRSQPKMALIVVLAVWLAPKLRRLGRPPRS